MDPAEDIDLDAPLTLQEACEIVFRGKIKPSTLRAERDRGNLVVERVGRRDFVTLRAIREMRERCRVKGEAPACGSDQPGGTSGEGSRTTPSGLSSEDQSRSAQAAVKTIAKQLKQPSRNTSRSSTSPTPANVIPIESQ